MLHEWDQYDQTEKSVDNGRNSGHEIYHLLEKRMQHTGAKIYKEDGGKHSQWYAQDQGSGRNAKAAHNHGKNAEQFAKRLPAQAKQKESQSEFRIKKQGIATNLPQCPILLPYQTEHFIKTKSRKAF